MSPVSTGVRLAQGGSIASVHMLAEAEGCIRGLVPMLISRVSAGFPSPAEDYIDGGLDLNELLVRHPAATFFVRVSGDSMIGAGMHAGDILVVDRAAGAVNGSIIIAALHGEFTVKRLVREKGEIYLVPENPAYSATRVTADMGFEVWGVVTCVIHRL